MNRRHVLQTAGGIAGASILGTTGVLARQDQGGQGRDNRRRRDAELLEGVMVETKTSDPEAANFEEEFTYYVVRFPGEYTFEEYREPARTGPDVYGLSGSGNAFWFGVSAPDEDGIQHEIQHRGQAVLYLTDDEGNWYEVRARFDGQGNLVNVNGVSP
ncbi:hypothetical protein [Natronosalvus caseinilyticus]|uniref:hypothetical protein n=1 Tax=Natronosalvus caseinilyticus TaxID=2953747 RepID=UPI0028A7318E|nr:hypothetical protein [Natronosalvus caseinilyticus]